MLRFRTPSGRLIPLHPVWPRCAKRLWPPVLPAILACLAACPASPAQAQEATATAGETVVVKLHEATTIYIYPGAAKVFIATPAIADVDASRAGQLIVYGREPGTTGMIVTGRDGREHTYRIQVSRQLDDIKAAVNRIAPSANVVITETPEGLRVTGSVATPEDAAEIKSAITGFLTSKETISFDARIRSSVQVLLQVRVAEVSKQANNYLGFNWASSALTGGFQIGLMTGRAATVSGGFTPPSNAFGSLGLGYTGSSGNSLSAILDALKEEDLVSILAEPNLTAISGSHASFVEGGEFPVPITQGLGNAQSTTIEWKEFGIKVDFTPTVIDEHRINIKVYSEVSELSQIGAVSLNGNVIPSLTVRKVDTTVDLASGQSFAIAGLFKNESTSTTQGLPFLASMPVLGALFRSRAFQHDQSELVIMITPYIVTPVANPADIHLPTDDIAFTSDLEQILKADVTRKTATPASEHLKGPGGFMLEDGQ